MIIDAILCSKPCKVGVRYLEDGTKVRVSRGIGASGSIIPRPEILKIRTTPRPTARMYLDSSLYAMLCLIAYLKTFYSVCCTIFGTISIFKILSKFLHMKRRNYSF